MRLLLITILAAVAAYSQPAGGVTQIPGPPQACSATITTNCTPKTDSAGALSIGTTVLGNAINNQTGTTYTLISTDNGKIVTFSNASAITLIIPAGLPLGFSCLIVQLGAGAVTPTASSTTIYQRQSFTKTAGQYAIATLVSHLTDTYILAGDLQ